MTALQTSLYRAIEQFPHQLLAEIVVRKIEEQGVVMSEREKRKVRAAVLDSDADEVVMRRGRWWDKTQIRIELSDEDVATVQEGYEAFLHEELPHLIDESSDSVADAMLTRLNKSWQSEQRHQRRTVKRFRADLRRTWSAPLSRLRMLLTVSRDLPLVAWADRESSAERNEPLIGVQRRLHARGCQMADEVLCLLEAGHADGAMARWRSLHEVAVVALFLRDKGSAVVTRYLDHAAVESSRAAHEYQRHYEALGMESLSPEELDEIDQACGQMLERYGKRFGTPYGWAAEVIDQPRPGLADLEAAVGVDHLRSYYRMASHQVHANAKGMLVRLGLTDDANVLLTGPSDLGLDSPGQNAAISLLQIDTALVMSDVTLDGVVGAKVASKICDETCHLFAAVRNSLFG